VHGCHEIVVVVGPAAVAAEVVEFADREGVFAAVVERIEDRDPLLFGTRFALGSLGNSG